MTTEIRKWYFSFARAICSQFQHSWALLHTQYALILDAYAFLLSSAYRLAERGEAILGGPWESWPYKVNLDKCWPLIIENLQGIQFRLYCVLECGRFPLSLDSFLTTVVYFAHEIVFGRLRCVLISGNLSFLGDHKR